MKAPPCELFWEGFAGTAAVSRCLVGAPLDLVAWLGGKRRVAKLLLRALGLHPRQGARKLLLSDPGPWGWVWPVLLNPVTRIEVVAILRRWAAGCPACVEAGACSWCGGTGRALNASELWGWLASRPPAVDLAARTAGWLWLQARAASGAAIWWGGEQEERDEAGWQMGRTEGREGGQVPFEKSWRQGSADGKLDQPAGERNPGWRMGHARGAGEHIAGETARREGVDRQDLRRANPRGVDESWRSSAGDGREQRATEKGRGTGTHSRGIIFPTTLADRIEQLAAGRWPASTAIWHGSAETIAAFLVLQAGNGRGRPVELSDGAWRTAGFAHLSESAREKGFTERLQLPILGDRVDQLGQGDWPEEIAGAVSSAEAVAPLAHAVGKGLCAFFDPPYHVDGEEERLRTGYGWDLSLERCLQLFATTADTGARVLITEGGPLARRLGPGWHSADITPHFSGRVVGQEWVTANFPIELGSTRGRQHSLPF